MFRLTSSHTRPGRRARRALQSAQVLDDVVEKQLTLVAHLPEESRHRAGDYLAELVLLAQAYRHYAAGWISKRDLDHRGLVTVQRLGQLRRAEPPASQLTDTD
ncbi:hypothetical protein [Herbihabitans rhizosphaerae]|uniref:hypothetical protein n=1 Tax=Herbihabitans rhizosphaerae TaxID=1872711 RepID=UPI00102B2B64|nr:hypothetical protein [Herbihabitans rhizosphaerae]